MDNITALIFSCSRDASLLAECIHSLTPEMPVVVALDENDSLSGLDLPGVRTVKTKFPRGFSLNQSPECISGILDTMLEIDTDHILKIDSDVVLLKPPTFDLSAFDIVGQKGVASYLSQGREYHSHSYAKGAAYIISRRILRYAASLDRGDLLTAADCRSKGMLGKNPRITWPEDEVISQIVKMLSPDENRWAFIDGPPLEFVADYDFDLATAPAGNFVNCGNLYRTTKDEGRERILDAMLEFRTPSKP